MGKKAADQEAVLKSHERQNQQDESKGKSGRGGRKGGKDRDRDWGKGNRKGGKRNDAEGKASGKGRGDDAPVPKASASTKIDGPVNVYASPGKGSAGKGSWGSPKSKAASPSGPVIKMEEMPALPTSKAPTRAAVAWGAKAAPRPKTA